VQAMITLELVDQMRKRSNCSYEEAKFFLEKHNGDVLEAIVDFERSKSSARFINNDAKKQVNNLWQSVCALIKKGFETRVVLEGNNHVLINIPVNILILFTIFTSYIVIPLLIIMLMLGYKLSIVKSKGEVVNISKIIDNVTGNGLNKDPNVQQQKQEITVASEEQQNNYNEMTIE